MKKILMLAITAMLVFSLVGCGNSDEAQTPQDGNNTSGEATDKEEPENSESGQDITLDQINEFLNTSADLGPGTVVNPVAILPMKHIDGPKNNIDVYAFVNFEYEARDFVKYQVSYISCTCRPAVVNYWNVAYVEMTLPSSKDPNDVQLKYLSFDDDPAADYKGGLWGDSDPIPSGLTYETIKEEYVPFFFGKDLPYLKDIDTIDDIQLADYQEGEGRSGYEIDTFTGATVSANNMIRMLHSVLDYHVQNEFFE